MKISKGNPILVSSCLTGINCRYDGRNKLNSRVINFLKGKIYVTVCPELFSGFTIPHLPSEISGGDGKDVLIGKAKVVNSQGVDVTAEYIRGALITLEIAKKKGVLSAILKDRSPACGVSFIHKGKFKGELKKGIGVTAAVLMNNGIKVLSEELNCPGTDPD